MSEWSVYVLRDAENCLYVGITTDVSRRLREHREGGVRGAKYTRSRKRLELVYSCLIGSRSLASKIEYRLKRCVKRDKEAIVAQSLPAKELLIRLGIQEGGY